MNAEIAARLEYLRGELRAERMSYGELAELQGLSTHIDAGDVELLEAAGVPESETCEAIPNTPLYRAMASGHRNRTGHDLAGYMTPQEDGYTYVMVRTCCDSEAKS